MTDSFVDIIRHYCAPLLPLPTQVEPMPRQLPGIRAILFDIYGTLLISDSGDVGGTSADRKQAAIRAVAAGHDISMTESPAMAIELFDATIQHSHHEARASGIEYPEVDIVRIWKQTLEQLITTPVDRIDLRRFALEFELRVNPVWPMPDLLPTIAALRDPGRVLGIVSNAQFFTPLLFPALVDDSLTELGFTPDLSFFSYAHGQAKPGCKLYEMAKDRLEAHDIAATEVLYVGNDMLNDIAAAAQVGFRTALFAGDQRSLRWREGDERVRGIAPDLVVTQLSQLIDVIRGE